MIFFSNLHVKSGILKDFLIFKQVLLLINSFEKNVSNFLRREILENILINIFAM